MRRRAALLTTALLASSWAPSLEAQDPGRLRALLVGVGHYAPGTEWWPLAAAHDLELLRDALRGHVGELSELRDAEATRAGILRALDERLLEPSQAGDRVILFFSGHGQQLEDQPGGDETDRLDEALVPYDAPRRAVGGYRGERHLRDDELGAWLERLRHRLGPHGHVLVLLDTCFSGSGTRHGTPSRGGPPLRFGPDLEPLALDEGSGLWDREATGELAPLVVLSAARADQVALEVRAPDGRLAGPLSLGLHRALRGSSARVGTYRELHQRVRRALVALDAWADPQAEGALDAPFLGRGEVRTAASWAPSLELARLAPGAGRFWLRPGSLAGLAAGAEVEVHLDGSSRARAASRLGLARVRSSSALEAEAELEAPLPDEVLRSARFLLTRPSFGTATLGVRWPPGAAVQARHRALARDLEPIAALDWQSPNPEVEIVPGGNPAPTWELRDVASGRTLAGPWAAADARTLPRLRERLRSLSRAHYLRRLDLHDPEIHVDFEIVPLEVTDCRDPLRPSFESCQVRPLPSQAFTSKGGSLVLPLQRFFALRFQPSARPAYVVVLDLPSDGTVHQLWPAEAPAEKVVRGFAPDGLLRVLFRATLPSGQDTLLLLASETPIDLWPLYLPTLEGETTRGRGALSVLAPLFDDVTLRNRATPLFPPGGLSTSIRTFVVPPPPEAP
jgi:metacaspase-1